MAHTHTYTLQTPSLTRFNKFQKSQPTNTVIVTLYLTGSRTSFWVNIIIQANDMEITEVEVACNWLHFLHICRLLWDFLLESLALHFNTNQGLPWRSLFHVHDEYPKSRSSPCHILPNLAWVVFGCLPFQSVSQHLTFLSLAWYFRERRIPGFHLQELHSALQGDLANWIIAVFSQMLRHPPLDHTDHNLRPKSDDEGWKKWPSWLDQSKIRGATSEKNWKGFLQPRWFSRKSETAVICR